MTFAAPATLPLWTARWSGQRLRERMETSPRAFRRSFQLDPYSEAERKLPNFEPTVRRCERVTVEAIRKMYPDMVAFMGLDPGGKGREGTSIFVLGVRGQQRYPLAVKFGAWGSREAAEAVIRVYQTWKPAVVYVENNSLQESYMALIQLIPRAPAIPLKGFMTGQNKSDPNIGIEGMDVELMNGLWVIPAGEFSQHDIGCDCDWCRWRNEMQNYPNWETSDGVMATWFAWNAARKGNYDMNEEPVTVGDLQSLEGLSRIPERADPIADEDDVDDEDEEDEISGRIESYDM